MGLFDKFKNMQQDAMEQAKAAQQQYGGGDGSAMSAGAMPTSQDFADRDAMQAQGNEYRRLLAEGLTGNATIVSADDTGERLHGNSVLDLKLAITPDGGDAYTTDLRYIIAGGDMSGYAPGSSYPVRIDPADRSKVTFG
jgi:hypothetical protein